MKTVVTGGSGYLGTHIRRFLNADDFSRRSELDILDPDDVRKIADYDVVVHLAAKLDKSAAATEDVFRTNVEGTVNVLKNMREGATFIFASTKDVYGRFADNFDMVPETCPTLYAGQTALEWSKLVAEQYVAYYAEQNKFRSCIFRLSTVYAPMSEGNTPNFVGHYAEAINKGERFSLPGNGAPVRDFIHVDDVAKACMAFSDSVMRHGLYNLGGGRMNALNLNDLIEKMENVSGLQAVIDRDTRLPRPIPLNFVTDIRLITQELDWKPTIALDDGLKTLF